ncbi:MAG: galactofuranosylgalactofuranosylrhamnosyl-N-acetylglucosaminyl-diphospho-decaprenol [Pseudonocardiales bacterium]|nr:glfT1 [Pseudonocardiales bacterium]MDT7714390.1 galactofuranosylgalactofuranosylrhamnosyl-N-acetylglucosaminyl-diphospho-decaprenol [Pseudonocardiales bacterium]
MTTQEAADPQALAMGEGNDPVEVPTAIERAARREAARNNAADSKLSDVSSLQVGPAVGLVAPQRVLHRVVMPRADDPPAVRPLYLDEPETLHGRTAEVTSRSTVILPPACQLSFATYFNAFPASYWKRWTRVEEVALRLTVRGSGRVDLYRSKSNGDVVHLEGKQFDAVADPIQLEFRESLAPFEDGGWVWFDVATERGSLTVTDAAWIVDEPLPVRPLAVAITTFNRPADCVTALAALAEEQAVLDVVAKVFVVDQGSVKVRDHQRFADVAAQLADRLVVIDQENLGGSGGFTRGMLEALRTTGIEHVMLMDDDVRLEPDSVLRAHAFASATSSPVIVGAQMLNLQVRSQLHAMGEIVDLRTSFWRPAPGSVYEHDFAKLTLRNQRLLHARIHSTYNGWWMCLFPREILERTGLPLPLFIKWDDAEYALRAAECGFPTVTLPGCAIWHMPWTDKDDATDWTAYFHLRNRLITLALHSTYDVRRAIVQDGFRTTFKHLMAMEYSTVALHHKSIEDFLAGPERLFASLRDALPAVRKLREGYDDARTFSSAQQLPMPLFDPVRVERLLEPPTHPVAIAKRALSTVSRHLRAPEPQTRDRPQINVPAGNARWFLLGMVDSATVSNADGSGVAFRKRDPQQFRALLARTIVLYRRLVAEWDVTAHRYRAAVPDLTSVESWETMFDQRGEGDAR